MNPILTIINMGSRQANLSPHACQRCYSRKTKCDRQLPQCSACARSKSLCQYSNKRVDRVLSQECLRGLEKRLKTLEHSNDQLRQRLAWQSPLVHGDPELLENGCVPGARRSSGADRTQRCESSRVPATPVSREYDPGYRERFHEPLHRTPGESTRYLGCSNGADFVQVVERVVESSSVGSGDLLQRMTEKHSAIETSSPVIRHPETRSQLPFPRLVDQVVAMPLINAYFEHWHLTFPLIYRPAFMEMVQRIYADPQVYYNDTGSAFAFDIVLALGLASSKRFEWSFGDTESYLTRASDRLDALCKARDMRSLQALLLCSEYGIHASLRDTSSEIWHLLGRATSLCMELGLQKDSSTPLSRCDIHLTGLIPQSVQVEMQRRCFWCYHNLERIVSISLGRPLALHEDDIEVPLPSHLEDNLLDMGVTMSGGSAHAADELTSSSPFLQHIRLRKIQARIHRTMYTSRVSRTLPTSAKQSLRKELSDELDRWLGQVPSLPLPSNSNNNRPVIPSGFLHPSWYQALYYSAYLLLYRPSTTFPAATSFDADSEGNDVLRTVWHSSRNVLTKYLEVLQARCLNYSWVCLYTIFMAGLANVYSVGRCAQRRKRGIAGFLPPYLDVVADIRDCSNILTAICERWDDVRSSCEIFNRFSMSALRELTSASFPRDGDIHPNLDTPGSNAPTSDNVDSARGSEHCPSGFQQYEHGLGLSSSTYAHSSLDSDAGCYDPTAELCPLEQQSPEELGNVLGFQELFQDMQDSVHDMNGDPHRSNEVMLGFSQDWFGR